MHETRKEAHTELEKVLASKILSRAPNLASILRYICREHLAGRAAEIKEYTIAVQALGRGQAFDPARDSIVRVEFSRLRKRLQQYYESEGASHALHIELSEVGYVPRFVRNGRCAGGQPGEEQAPVPVESPLPRPHAWRKPVLLSSLLVGLAVCLAFLFLFVASPARSSEPRVAVSSVAPMGEARIAAGSSREKYRDNMGRLWASDRFFDGGLPMSRPDRPIAQTLDPTLYRSAREGDFRYDIPLKPGLYELHLHFAEIIAEESVVSSAQSLRRFFVTLNGKPLLSDFDIAVDAPGSNTADERVFKDVSPAEDGFLHLRFLSFYGKALLSGIEVVPGIPGKMHPLRILTGPRSHYDRQERFWGPDRHFSGGRFRSRSAAIGRTIDPELYGGERFGNFQYSVPVADAQYAVTLRFAESNFGVRDFGASSESPGGIGSRRFDIYSNGTAIARDLDIFKEAGGPNIALEKTFHGLRPNAQGKLVLSFVPVKDYATVRSIEVVDEGP